MVQPTGNYTATLLLNTQYVVVIRSRTRGTIHHRCLACAFLWLIIPIFDPMRRSHSGKAILSLHPSIKVRTFQAARSGGILYIFFFRSGDSAVHPIRKIRLGRYFDSWFKFYTRHIHKKVVRWCWFVDDGGGGGHDLQMVMVIARIL